MELQADEVVPYHHGFVHTASLYRVRMPVRREILGRPLTRERDAEGSDEP